jgi:hypothetical protein
MMLISVLKAIGVFISILGWFAFIIILAVLLSNEDREL